MLAAADRVTVSSELCPWENDEDRGGDAGGEGEGEGGDEDFHK